MKAWCFGCQPFFVVAICVEVDELLQVRRGMATYTERSLEAERASLPRADDSATGNVNSIQQPPNPK